MNGLAICAGIGGLELGLKLAIPNYRTVCYVEREAFAAATLVARMEDKTLDEAPVWDDITTFSGSEWRGTVDIVSAGFPCQPWSIAGKQQKTNDNRWLWPDIARIIREVGPQLVFLENVPGLLRGGIEHVLGDLASMGFDAKWGVFSAGELGAPHIRKRIFILAHTKGKRTRPRTLSLGDEAEKPLTGDTGEMEHTNNQRLQRPRTQQTHPKKRKPPWPPSPNDDEGWREVINQDPSLKPALCRMADGTPNQLEQSPLAFNEDRLRALGNAVVPIVAAQALKELMK